MIEEEKIRIEREELLPPIIVDIIRSALSKKNPPHVRDNACGRLEQIVKSCEAAIVEFRNDQNRYFRKSR